MTIQRMVHLGLVVVTACAIAAILAITLDLASYWRSYRRWKKGK